MIKQYTIVSSITQRPIRYYHCPESDIDIILKEDEYAIEGRIEASETQEEVLSKIRMQRDFLLSQSDWTQLPDAQLTADQKESWRVYRQELRDLPDSADLTNVEWPIAP